MGQDFFDVQYYTLFLFRLEQAAIAENADVEKGKDFIYKTNTKLKRKKKKKKNTHRGKLSLGTK